MNTEAFIFTILSLGSINGWVFANTRQPLSYLAYAMFFPSACTIFCVIVFKKSEESYYDAVTNFGNHSFGPDIWVVFWCFGACSLTAIFVLLCLFFNYLLNWAIENKNATMETTIQAVNPHNRKQWSGFIRAGGEV